ncbi:UDP-N-acetylmuramoyl-L-alanyl-D-glutamate--2,6-diaminopimelate ligase [Corynebacterium nuruki]|uniref:UDP-N-acetylmuramoyl-L-alanyl-D-glutamate--2, 6-diaminopimelate ligase n=1 Tax=Corynebacterium nuruki TaxID=1032851 RepID=UPI0039BF21A9
MTTSAGATLARLADLTGGRLEKPSGGTPEGTAVVGSAAIGAADVPADGMFMAVPGARHHGAEFAAQSAGSSVLTDDEGLRILTDAGYPGTVLVVDDCRRWLGPVAAEIHGHPTRGMTVIGVTGTSGKTTTTYMMEHALLAESAADPAVGGVGLIGTTGTRINGTPVPTSLTTPEAPTLQALFARMRDEGVTRVVMEISSHALVLVRVRGVDVDVAGFTNLSQDHLDFHPTMEDYFRAKAQLFTDAQDPGREPAAPVVCVDDSWGRRLADDLTAAGRTVTTVASDPDTDGSPATWQVREVTVGVDGTQQVTVDHDGTATTFDLSLPGDFNVANAVLALATLAESDRVTGIADVTAAVDRYAAQLGDVRVPGRMQSVTGTRVRPDYLALVDYAHKPGAVAAVLHTLVGQRDRAGHGGRIGIVLGAGGNRDHEKRPLMGEQAAALADLVIVTDDNPREEDPATIRAAVLAGAEQAAGSAEVREVGDRHTAIRDLVAWARRGDILVVAGKGHEKGQIIGDTVVDFDDVAELAAAIDDSGDDSGDDRAESDRQETEA